MVLDLKISLVCFGHMIIFACLDHRHLAMQSFVLSSAPFPLVFWLFVVSVWGRVRDVPCQLLGILHPHQFKVLIQCLQLTAIAVGLPGGVSLGLPHLVFQVPLVRPSMSDDLIHEPLHVICGSKVIWIQLYPVGEQDIVIFMVWS